MMCSNNFDVVGNTLTGQVLHLYKKNGASNKEN